MTVHIPVLSKETIEALGLRPGMSVLDATGGGGGHSELIAKGIYPGGRLLILDRDKEAVERLKKRFESSSVLVEVQKTNFRNLDEVLKKSQMDTVDAALFDLGFSSDQLEVSGRGFSFLRDEPLLMNMGDGEETAMDIVNLRSEDELRGILERYGEEGFARQIARGIVERRRDGVISTTFELVEVIKASTPAWYSKKKTHPATKTFQALRIAVNDELGAVEEALPKALKVLSFEGRIAVITFHSLEDRLVKEMFAGWEKEGLGKRVNKKVITAAREEILKNPRSRSAKLRVFQKLH